MSSKITVVGSSMIDFTTYSSRLPKPGETIFGSKFTQSFGGKGANQCVAAARLGASTTFITSLGSDIFAQQYIDKLKAEGVDVSYTKLRKDAHSGVAQIVVAENGENSIVIIPGSNELLSTEDLEESQNIIRLSPVLLCQFETPLNVTLHALKLHQNCGTSIVNGAPAVANTDPEILRLAGIFCVNETEAECMTGIENLTLSNAQKAIDKLLLMGCNTVIITFGSSGVVFASKNDPTMVVVDADKVRSVDTTGAGDAFLGALAYYKAYHPNLSMKESIRRSCKIATQSVLKPGTQTSFPRKEELSADLFL